MAKESYMLAYGRFVLCCMLAGAGKTAAAQTDHRDDTANPDETSPSDSTTPHRDTVGAEGPVDSSDSEKPPLEGDDVSPVDSEAPGAPSAADADDSTPTAEIAEGGELNAGDGFDELLELSLEELLDTEVTTASKGAEKLSDAPGMITVVTKDEIRRFGGNTLKDILNRVPSLTTSTTYFPDRTTIAARGDQVRIDSGHVLILIDGRPTREVLQGGVASEVLESFPVSIIERIEVIKGPGSVLYGSNAFSAVINVITEKGTNDTLVKTIVGVPFSHGEFAKSTVSIGDLRLSAAGNYLKRADWKTTYEYNPEGTVDVRSQNVVIPNERAGAFLGVWYKGLSLTGMFNQWEHAYFNQGSVGDNTWRRGFGDVGYQLTVSEKLRWEMEFHATYTFAGMDSSDAPDIETRSHDIVGEWTNTIRILDNLRLVLGGLYNQIMGKEKAGGLDASDGKRRSGGFYAQVDYQPVEMLSLVAGMQLNKIEDIDASVLPRGGIIFNPIRQLNVKLLYGQAYRAPSINELTLREAELWGNPKLKPEMVQTLDFGISYLGEKINAGVNYFFTQQKDIIMVELTPSDRFDAPTYYDNIGKVRFHGVEFEGKYYIIDPLYLTASVLYFISKDGDDFEDVTPIPKLGVKGGISYMDELGIMASLFYIHQGKLDEKYNARLNPSPEPQHILNVRVGFDFARFFKLKMPEELILFAEGENMLNQEVYLPDWGGVYGETIPVNPGRTIYFGLSGRFGYNR